MLGWDDVEGQRAATSPQVLTPSLPASNLPVLVTGDFNLQPGSPVHSFLLERSIATGTVQLRGDGTCVFV